MYKNVRNEVLDGLKRIEEGTLLPRNQKNFKGFKTIKEIKLKETRMVVQSGKNGKPLKICAIFRKAELDNIVKSFKGKYE